ncbi:hypothetical protein SAMD00024442_6_49 [Candidatus Symbiothrix dinenymphae]|nr:hypothetical protein SAMD00024442_6_49 [Candidatus Symbiothrix dinenymphae]
MAILTDISQFTNYIPTATGSNLDDLQSFLSEAEQWFESEIAGTDLYEYIAASAETTPVRKQAQTAICLKAYLTAIPFVDLIQTDNGFAVVNNANHAPASKERVDKLLRNVEHRLTVSLDMLFTWFMKDDVLRGEWQKAIFLFDRFTETVYLTTQELEHHAARSSVTFSELQGMHPLILKEQTDIARFISGEYMQELLDKRRNATLTEADGKAFAVVQNIIGLRLQGIDTYHLIERLINWMTANPDEFPTYMQSTAYALKTAPKYENKKRDSTYFFG